MDEKIKKKLNVSFIVVIAITIVFPFLSAFLFHTLTSEAMPQWYWGLILSGGPILSFLLIAVACIAYLMGCIYLAKIKGYSGSLGLLSLIPFLGILILILLKNKNGEAEFKSIYVTPILATLIPVFIIFTSSFIIFKMTNTETSSDSKIIQLVDPTDSKRIVFEQDEFIFSMGYNDFESTLKDDISKFSSGGDTRFLAFQEGLLFYIENEGSNKDEIRVENSKQILSEIDLNTILKEINPESSFEGVGIEVHFKGTIENQVISILESGKLMLYDKKNKKYIKEIKFEMFGNNCGALCGSGGRKYVVPKGDGFFDSDRVLFSTTDWMS